MQTLRAVDNIVFHDRADLLAKSFSRKAAKAQSATAIQGFFGSLRLCAFAGETFRQKVRPIEKNNVVNSTQGLQ